MSFLEKNLASLRKLAPAAASAVSDIRPLPLVVRKTPTGLETALLDGVYIHSGFDPKREAEKLVRTSLGCQSDTIIIYGFGLGYHVEAALETCYEANVFVLEPDSALFRAVLEIRDFSALFQNERIRLLIDSDADHVGEFFTRPENELFQVLRLRSTYTRNSEYFQRIDEVLGRLTSRREININTLKRFGRLWVRNLSRNIRLLAGAPGISHLENRFAGIPALILAAGPSLDRILSRLPELRKRFLLIAVDTSYSVCLRHGVEPDFVVVVDPQYWNTRHLDRARQSASLLVSESSTHPAVFRRLPGKVFLGSSIFPLGRFLEKAAGYKGRLGAGGSVATSAWDFARLLGAGPLFIAGLDLGFPDKNTHFKGSFFEDRSFSMANRFSTAETHSVSYLLDGSPCCLPANDGSEVMTDKRMIIYQWWFEAQAKLHPEPKTYNLSEKGLKIEGFPVTDFKDLLSYPIMREKVDEILEKIRGLQETNFDPKYLDAAFQSLFQELIFLESATQKGLNEIERLRGLPEKDRTTDFSTLEALDREILSCENRDIAGFLLASTLTLTDDPALSKLDSLLARSERIYRDLLDSARFHRECLGEGRQR